jgi:uncharacterized protein YydD (DUF2326 family)
MAKTKLSKKTKGLFKQLDKIHEQVRENRIEMDKLHHQIEEDYREAQKLIQALKALKKPTNE